MDILLGNKKALVSEDTKAELSILCLVRQTPAEFAFVAIAGFEFCCNAF